MALAAPDDLRFNLDIIPITDVCVKPGDTFSFEVVTRLAAGGNANFGLGNIDYSIDLGITTITFEGVNADGSFATGVASTSGSVSGFMVDLADADNDFIPSTSASKFGILNGSDTLDRPDPNDASWDADWVFQIFWGDGSVGPVVDQRSPLGGFARLQERLPVVMGGFGEGVFSLLIRKGKQHDEQNRKTNGPGFCYGRCRRCECAGSVVGS